MKTRLFTAICLIMTYAVASGQDHPNVPSSDIDRSVQAVDLSIHAEADGQAHEQHPSGISAKLTMSDLRPPKPVARSVVWPHTSAVPDTPSQSDKLTFDRFQQTVQAPITAVWPGLTSVTAPAFATGRYSKTPDLHPKHFGALPPYVTNNDSAPSLGIGGVFPPSSPLDETRGLTERFGNEPGGTRYGFFPEMTFSRHKGQIGTRKRKRPEQIANSASTVASPKSVATAKH